jgi:hypothetical protein
VGTEVKTTVRRGFIYGHTTEDNKVFVPGCIATMMRPLCHSLHRSVILFPAHLTMLRMSATLPFSKDRQELQSNGLSYKLKPALSIFLAVKNFRQFGNTPESGGSQLVPTCRETQDHILSFFYFLLDWLRRAGEIFFEAWIIY